MYKLKRGQKKLQLFVHVFMIYGIFCPYKKYIDVRINVRYTKKERTDKMKKANVKVTNNMLRIYTEVSKEIKARGQEVDNIGYYKDFEIKGSGLAINDAYIVKLKDVNKAKENNYKDDKIKDESEQRQKIMYEIYDEDSNLVATVNELGEIQFDEEFLENLREINEEYFNSLTLDEAEFELPEELEKDDVVLNKQELEEKQSEKRLEEVSKKLGTNEIESYSEINTDQIPEFEKITNKQELDANVRVTQTETLADLIPEIREKGIEKIGVVYSDHSKGQNGRFSFVGIDKDGKIQTIDSLENIDGTTTGQKVTSINSVDGSSVEQEQVAGMVRLGNRGTTNGEEEYLSVRQGDYGIIEVDYVRADLSKPEDERYISAPIETKNIYPTTREVRDFMDRSKNPEIGDELKRANPEIKRDGETEARNIDDTASNDMVTPDDIIVLEDGTETTLRQEATKDKVSPEEFTRRYNEMGGKTPDKKIDYLHEEIEEEFGAPTRGR